MLGALLIPVIVAFAVLPRRATERRAGFPWFWVVFPVTCVALGRVVAGALIPTRSYAHGPSRYAATDGLPIDQFTLLNIEAGFWTFAAVVGVGLSIWAWRKRRV